jgi:hypothetical protein
MTKDLNLPLVVVVGLRGGVFELFEAFFGANKLVGLSERCHMGLQQRKCSGSA